MKTNLKMITSIMSLSLTEDIQNEKVNLYECLFPQCNKAFGKKSRLVQHERTHTGERPFKCSHDGCVKSYTRNFHLTRHLTKAHSNETIIEECLSCDVCQNIYSNKYSLAKHKRTHDTAPYTCIICGKSFHKQQQFESHFNEHTGIKPYKCEYPGCNKTFSVVGRLKKHSDIHVPDRYKCYHENCTHTFNGFNLYRKHLLSDHIQVCTECKKEFPTNHKLKMHLKTHQKSEIFHCPFTPCDRYYFYEKNLKAHIRINHDSNFEGFKCKNCDKVLSSKQKLKEHQKIHSSAYPGRCKSNKSRRPRKDKGVRKRSIYSVLSGYDDSTANAEIIPVGACHTTDSVAVNEPSISCAAVLARVTSNIIATLQMETTAGVQVSAQSSPS